MVDSRHSLTFRGQEVTSFWGRAGVGALLLVGMPIIWAMLLMSLPVHAALRLLGREGFLIHQGGEEPNYHLSTQGFRRAA